MPWPDAHARSKISNRSPLLVLPTLAVLTLAVLWWLQPSQLEAHPTHGPSLGERYLKLDFREDRVRTIYGLTYAARHGRRIRTKADENADGIVSDQEQAQQGESFRQQVQETVKLRVDGEEQILEWNEPFLNGIAGRIGPGPATVEMNSELPLSPGLHRVELEDRAEFVGIYRTTVAIAFNGEVELIRAGKGRDPSGRSRRMVFMDLPSPGTPPSRFVMAELRLPGEVGPSLRAIQGALIGAGVMIGLALILLMGWRRIRG